MTGITRRLAEFIAGIDFASLDPEVVERTRMLLLDQVGHLHSRAATTRD